MVDLVPSRFDLADSLTYLIGVMPVFRSSACVPTPPGWSHFLLPRRHDETSDLGDRSLSMTQSPNPHEARQKALADALSGVLASLVSLWIFYPIDVCKTRHAAGSHDDTHDAPTTSLSWKELFAGWHIKTCHTTCSSFCYFYLYSWIVSWYTKKKRRQDQKLSTSTRLVLSAVAAMLNTCLTLPLDVVSARKQTKVENSKLIDQKEEEEEEEEGNNMKENDYCSEGEEKKEESFEAMRREMWTAIPSNAEPEESNDSFSLWKGLWPSLLLCSNPAIHYTVFDSLKLQLLNNRDDHKKNSLTMPEACKFLSTTNQLPHSITLTHLHSLPTDS